MAVRITYFVHGASVDNETGVSSGWSDAPLSETGRKQATALKDAIAGKQFDAAFCSDSIRASETAKLAFSEMTPIIPDARLRECNYGDYNANPSSIVEPMHEASIIQRFPNGESYEDVRRRVADFLDFLRENYDGKRVAIVAHKAPQLALDVLLKGRTWEQAFTEDWRKTKSWQPGWEYELR